jgi:hypothetical protein
MNPKLQTFITAATLVAWLTTGCSDDPEITSPPPPVNPAQQSAVDIAPDTGVVPPPSGVNAPSTTPAATATPEQEIPSKDALEAVTMATQSFFIRHDRAPNTLEELVSSGFLRKLPAPPAGKKYVYDPERANIKLEDL